ncbi:cytoglobin-1-like [Mytilus californianus]|uniref:cytoglobin-1-like n=1 Tax=Mytilus californianus TaxID=6549 RepID=UPI0022451655|nr:cytoglobin-1-like [Mytilus californianus]
MGCTYSDVRFDNPDAQITSFVSEEEVKLVLDSWIILRNDTNVGLHIFKRFFQLHPEFKKLFTEQMMVEDDDLKVNEEKLRHHGNIVMEGLGAAVESLDDSVFLSNVLVTMGESHARHNVKSEMVILLWPAIRDAFNGCLGSDFTAQMATAWEHVFEYMATKFKEGLRKESKHAR